MIIYVNDMDQVKRVSARRRVSLFTDLLETGVFPAIELNARHADQDGTI